MGSGTTYIINIKVCNHGQLEANVALECGVGFEDVEMVNANNRLHEA